MKIADKIRKFKLYKFILQEKNDTRILVRCAREVGWAMPVIRWALLKHLNIDVRSLINGNRLSEKTLYATIKGTRNNPLAQELVADAIGLSVTELWPEE